MTFNQSAVTADFLGGAVRILSEETYSAEKEMHATAGTGDQAFRYVPYIFKGEDGYEESMVLALNADASEEQVEQVRKDTDAAKKAQQKRAKASGISIKSGGNLTKPSKYSDVPDSKDSWLDWTNYKYPVDDEDHVKAAASYMGKADNQKAGGYTAEEWSKMETQLEARKKALGIGQDASEDDKKDKGHTPAADDPDGAVPSAGEGGGASPAQPATPSRDDLARQYGIAIKVKELTPPAGLETQFEQPEQWADPVNRRFPCATKEQAHSSLSEWAQTMANQPGLYTPTEVGVVMKRLGEAYAGLNRRVCKSVAEDFDQKLDAALDQALLGAIDGVYYAWVRSFAGSYWDGDPDQLTREEFGQLAQQFMDAVLMVYDRLADAEGGDEGTDPNQKQRLKGAFVSAQETIERAIQARALEQVQGLAVAHKTGQGLSEADRARMDAVYGALVGLGYAGQSPSQPGADAESASKALQAALGRVGQDGGEKLAAVAETLADAEAVATITKLYQEELARLQPSNGNPDPQAGSKQDKAAGTASTGNSDLSQGTGEPGSDTPEVARLKGELEAARDEVRQKEAALDTRTKELRSLQRKPATEPAGGEGQPPAPAQTSEDESQAEGWTPTSRRYMKNLTGTYGRGK